MMDTHHKQHRPYSICISFCASRITFLDAEKILCAHYCCIVYLVLQHFMYIVYIIYLYIARLSIQYTGLTLHTLYI